MRFNSKRVDDMEVDDSFDAMSSDRLLSKTLFIRSSGDNNAILIVEGVTDIKFYNSFVRGGECILYPGDFDSLIGISGVGNKGKVIETIKKANGEGIKGIIGIVDADFDNLDTIASVENLYRTDTHDLESMLIKSGKALEKALNQYCVTKHVISDEEIIEIQNTVLETSTYIGYALWCSIKYKWMINFKDFPMSIVINEECDIDFKKVCECMKIKSACDTLSIESIESIVTQKISENLDLWQVCRGKEMIRVLAEYIKYNFKCGAIGFDNLRKDFLLAFDNEDFRNTNLYVSMKDWERKNRDYSLIKF